MTKRSIFYSVMITLFIIVPAALFVNLTTGAEVVASGKVGMLPVVDGIDEAQQIAQRAALADPRVQAYTSGHRTEVFGVQTVSHQFSEATRECATADCRQVNIFNFDEAATIAAIVNVERATVLNVLYQPNIRPAINKRLADLAMEIALNAPEVVEVLGYQPTSSDWAPMDSSLVGTLCEEGHVCVAPTFDLDEYMLWAIVDLTDEKLLDLQWTSIPSEEGERAVRYPDDYDNLRAGGCEPQSGDVSQNGWSMAWENTAHDGFHLYNVSYNDQPVLTSAKLAEWHTDYGTSGFIDSTGCGGGGGGFQINASSEMQQVDLVDDEGNVIGFELVQDFRMIYWGNSCNYRYEQHYQFYDDGRYRVVAGAYGKGCNTSGIYRPIIRLDVAVNGDENDRIEVWDDGWRTQDSEIRWATNSPLSPEGYGWRVLDQSGVGYFIEPGRGQFNDGSKGDHEFLYAVQFKEGEGDGDLGVFTAGCCNDLQHGPEIYVNENESIENENLVLWYVPQFQTTATQQDYYCWTVSGEPNPETYPCFGGPMFVPVVRQPQANFEFAPAEYDRICDAPNDHAVQFVNQSTGGGDITYQWAVEGSTSSQENGTHCFMEPLEDSYPVTLTVTNEIGTDTITREWMNIEYAQASFTHTHSVEANHVVSFTNASAGGGTMSYQWDFGDGNRSNDIAPSHTYTESRVYTVTLTVSNELNSDTFSSAIEVLDEPTVVIMDDFRVERNSTVPTMLMLWGLASLLGIMISLTRIVSLRKE
ncbi:MAG: PKD domain-containing protein [Ardenticatenaceae bacterium]